MYTAKSHERYARAFVQQRVREVFEILDSKGDGFLDEEELLSHLWSVGYQASRQDVHDMVWEVDDRSTGVITLDAIRTVLKRLQKAKKRMPGTGTNLLRTLIEFMMFDSDGSAAIELEEIQQMFYVYYGYKGKELDMKVNEFSNERSKDGEIDFSEFLALMDKIGLTPVIGEPEVVKKAYKGNIPKARKSPRRHRRREADEEAECEEEFMMDGGMGSPRGKTSFPALASPRQAQNRTQLSEAKYRKIAERFLVEKAEEDRKRKEEAELQKEESTFTIRNALMKN